MKLLKIFLTKINKKDLKILCFVNNIKIKNIFWIFRKKYKWWWKKNRNNVFKSVWMKKYVNLFNYYDLTNDKLKLKRFYKNNNGNKNSEYNLESKI